MSSILSQLFVDLFKLREKHFGADVKYGYLPKEIDTVFLPMHMDFFWARKGFFGKNKCLVPKGNPYSARFDDGNKFFQTWIGTYSITNLGNKKFSTSLQMLNFFQQAAILDQNMWLKVYGVKNPKTFVISDSIKFIKEKKLGKNTQSIFYGEMRTNLDDYITNGKGVKFIHYLSTAIASVYNNKKVSKNLLEPDNDPTKGNGNIQLFGYYSIVPISKRKYLITYVCGSLKNKGIIDKELFKIIDKLEIIRT
jgi:hypothetical protein